MSGRELVVLGTASQVPTRTRAHNGYLLRWDGDRVLVDPGEGTQRQLLLAGLSAAHVDRVCLTHGHGDHCLGLPGIVQRRLLDGATTPLDLHYPAAAAPVVEGLLAATGPAAQTVRRHPVDPPPPGGTVVARTPRWTLSAHALDHRVPAVAWRFAEPDGVRFDPAALTAAGISGPAVGRLAAEGVLEVAGRQVRVEEVSVRRRGQVVAVVMDTRPCAGAVEAARDADLLVCEATFLARDAELADAYAHCTAAQAAGIARDAGAHRLLLTHFSQRYGDDGGPFEDEARAVFPDAGAARDLDVVALPARRG
ncbi:ribonuclease Z [Motilibacter rhizosphaerae]|uniref:Ribonuclease Z n=1 Tax=Motilibacter rhizosphaerae TaxID=598652 RepID=A0A4Q7NS40_9ACTN|nr:ribonuclease Z [Motilibacter rhizosphaerae]RZS87470.1 ribonuclease Z [Motilibacter rhizosphaerae]